MLGPGRAASTRDEDRPAAGARRRQTRADRATSGRPSDPHEHRRRRRRRRAPRAGSSRTSLAGPVTSGCGIDDAVQLPVLVVPHGWRNGRPSPTSAPLAPADGSRGTSARATYRTALSRSHPWYAGRVELGVVEDGVATDVQLTLPTPGEREGGGDVHRLPVPLRRHHFDAAGESPIADGGDERQVVGDADEGSRPARTMPSSAGDHCHQSRAATANAASGAPPRRR